MAISALMLPVIAGTALVAVDHVSVSNQLASLQRTADKSALAAARELRFVSSGRENIDDTLTAIAHGYAKENLPDSDLSTRAEQSGDSVVHVELTLNIDTQLSTIFGGTRTYVANAKAEIYTAQKICIISAETGRQNPGIDLKNRAEIKADTCGIYSNSMQSHSIRVDGDASIEAQFICSAGGYEGSDGSFSTKVTTDCPQIPDPLDNRPIPAIDTCNATLPNEIGADLSVNLSPGTYCGGLKIHENANVWFAPGVYVFRDGPLIIEGDAVVMGENVGLFFDDEDSYFEFRDNADISLSAPEIGPMAGILVSARKLCANSSCVSLRQFTITSAKVRSLLGTINLPQDDLTIDTTMPVSEEAAFTILIIDNLVMKQAPWLVLNTDYASTTVPVPDGFSGIKSTRLVE